MDVGQAVLGQASKPLLNNNTVRWNAHISGLTSGLLLSYRSAWQEAVYNLKVHLLLIAQHNRAENVQKTNYDWIPLLLPHPSVLHLYSSWEKSCFALGNLFFGPHWVHLKQKTPHFRAVSEVVRETVALSVKEGHRIMFQVLMRFSCFYPGHWLKPFVHVCMSVLFQ